MRILTLLLNLDAPAVLAAEKDGKHASLLQPYLAIVRLMCVWAWPSVLQCSVLVCKWSIHFCDRLVIRA